MKSFLVDVRNTLVPGHDTKHGPLPPLLVIMTLTTGLVDAFSYLTLGHVFVAMTGNIVFLGFALAGAQGFSITASLGHCRLHCRCCVWREAQLHVRSSPWPASQCRHIHPSVVLRR